MLPNSMPQSSGICNPRWLMGDDRKAGGAKVSVLVVTYNQQETIARTLDSILAQQTDFPFEIEIADDCSDDRTGEICRDYAARYPEKIRYTRNTKNLGVRENYFRALRRCRAEYIADCAGDDYWVDPLKLQKQAAVLDAHPEVGLVHTAWCYRDETTGTISPSDPSGENQRFLKPLMPPGALTEGVFVNKMLIHWCTALYRKSVFERAEKDDPYPFTDPEITFEDFQLSVVYSRDASVAYLPDITLHYTIGSDTFTHTRNRLKEFDFVFALTKLKRHYAEKFGMNSEFMRPIYNSAARFLYSMAFIDSDRSRLQAVDAFYKRYGLPRPWNCRIMSVLAKVSVLGSMARCLKKAHHNYKLRK